jgi:hypothetical protein
MEIVQASCRLDAVIGVGRHGLFAKQIALESGGLTGHDFSSLPKPDACDGVCYVMAETI